MHTIIEALTDTVKDTVLLVPFLFVTYLAMEWLESRTEEQYINLLSRIGRFSHLLGAGLGIIPQCGFSAGAASLYGGGVITAGTLIAVFLSTSDEMLPVFISSSIPAAVICKVLATKFIIAFVSGIAVDCVLRILHFGTHGEKHIHDLCERDRCGCDEEGGGIFKSAFVHTVRITVFIFLISFALSLLTGYVDGEILFSFMTDSPFLGAVLTGSIGLIPNCAASVFITQMYIEGVLTAGQLISGLLAGAGTGLIVLFRTNARPKENILITAVLLLAGICWGAVIDFAGITF